MPEFESKTHKVIVSNEGIMEIFPLAGRAIRESVISPDGTVTIVEHRAGHASDSMNKLLEALDTAPLLRTAYAGEGNFHVDMDCGATRWKGYKKHSDIVAGLKYCGFSAEMTKVIIALCTTHTHEFMARVG